MPTREGLKRRVGILLAFGLLAGGTGPAVATATAGGETASGTVPAIVPPCRARPLPEGERPRIGLVLGGGGARGIAHISVLRTLEELQVPVDCIAGTSMGALVGALYASGMRVDEIETLIRGVDWTTLFNDKLARPERSFRRKRDDELVLSQPGIGIGPKGIKIAPGLLAGERIILFFEKLTEPVATTEDFDRLPIPFRAVAADANSGEVVSIGDGDLAMAMRASMSIPGAFPPVEWRGRVLVDGGVASNLPVQIVRDMGADIVIAVDVGTPLGEVSADSSVLAIASQLSGLLTVNNTRASIAQLGAGDVLIRPELEGHVATAEFEKVEEALAIGRAATLPVQARLAALAVPPDRYREHASARVGRQSGPPVIDAMRIRNDSHYSDDFIAARLHIPLGEPLDALALERQLYALYGLDTLSRATYEVIREDGRNVVEVHVTGKSHGPTYVETGLSISSDFEGHFDFSFRLGLLRSPYNASGGEWRVFAQVGDDRQLLGEVYQPLGTSGFFLGARGQLTDNSLLSYDADGRKIAEYAVKRASLELVAGKEFSNIGALTLGYRRAWGESESELATSGGPALDFDIGETWLDLTFDRLDSIYLPRHGHLLRARYLASREALGADVDFDQVELDGLIARKFGQHSLQLGFRYHSTVDGTVPLQSLYRLGGYSRLVGFRVNELTGSDYALVLAGYNYEIGNLFNQPAVVGADVEYGNAWQSRTDISLGDGIANGSVYLSVDSWVGSILLGLGFREGGHRTLFLDIGKKF
jgi:NTE family protein